MNMVHAVLATTQIKGDPKCRFIYDFAVYIHFTLIIAWFDNLTQKLACTCADPEIFIRGGPTKMVIFGHRRGGVQPPKNPEITLF